MAVRLVFLLCFLLIRLSETEAQCSSGINTFPYNEGFELSDGGWTSGGVGNDWAWGAPAKPVISAAGSGSKCWVVGGLTGSSYTNSEASWLQSPCFDFTNLAYPFISFKLNWETEQQFDGGSFQYSVDNGTTWFTIGPANYTDCIQKNWFNQDPVTYLSPLTTERRGWSGNKQPSSGSCRGGNGSNGWVTAQTIAPGLAFRPSVIFRFIFGAGTICNNYDGFAVDDIYIGEAPPNSASFTYACINKTAVNFTSTSALCPTTYSWDFGEPASGINNTASTANPSHIYSAPGKYTVTLIVNGPGNAPSTTTKDISVIDIQIAMLNAADCQTNKGGSLIANITGATGPFLYSWNTNPVQTTPLAINLGSGVYTITVTGSDVCTATGNGEVTTDLSCVGVYFPSGFTPNNDGKNDGFGPLGSLTTISNFQLSIYNRWGERVYFSNNPFEKWDGMVKGIKTDGNIFVWFAEYSIQGKPKELRKGTVVLLR